jgi:hypothetical protein
MLTFSGGDIVISNPASLDISTSINFSGTNLTNNSNTANAFNATAGTFTFLPNAAQNINGAGSGNISFYNLIAAGGNTKTINPAIAIINDLTINNGVIVNLGTTAKTIDVTGTLTADGTLDFGTVAAKTVNLSGDLVDATGTLIMTGAGLAVAIPAVLAYNAFVRSNRVVLGKLDAFAHDLFAFLATGAHFGHVDTSHTVCAREGKAPQSLSTSKVA